MSRESRGIENFDKLVKNIIKEKKKTYKLKTAKLTKSECFFYNKYRFLHIYIYMDPAFHPFFVDGFAHGLRFICC